MRSRCKSATPVSDKFISAAIDFSTESSGISEESTHTAAGLPPNGFSVNASTTTTEYELIEWQSEIDKTIENLRKKAVPISKLIKKLLPHELDLLEKNELFNID